MLRRCCEYNSITVVTPYELRHTFVSIAKSLPAICGKHCFVVKK